MKFIRKTTSYLAAKGLLDWLSDERFLKMRYRVMTGNKLNLESPITFNEKLQWLKAFDKNSQHTVMVDKYEAKKYVASVIGDEYIIPTYGVWDSFDEINFSKLPNQFVLKCTHDSRSIVICKDKSVLDIDSARKILNDGLKRNFYKCNREWPYKNVRPRIIAEKFISKCDGSVPEDYKILNFNGEPKVIQVDLDRFEHHMKKLYSPEWEQFDFDFSFPSDKVRIIKKPDNLGQMLELARCLSKDEPFLRTDFYDIDGHIYFGELTFFPAGGYGKFIPEKWNEIWGDWIKLPEYKIL